MVAVKSQATTTVSRRFTNAPIHFELLVSRTKG